MPFNTFAVATAVTPSVIETYFSHYLNRGPLRQKPTAHISYHEGLRLIRQFLDFASKHTVEDLQSFTAQWVPAPTWVRIQDVEIAPQFLERSAKLVQQELGQSGIEKVGGPTWWQWRRPEVPLRAEWIEMKKDYNDRRRAGTKCDRVILYVHGGAYYFGSVDEHRYQMQRHARKLKARVLAPRYRLAPQFPFPCGIYDCIATYLYLLEHFDPSQILFAGDSAGGGMVLSMLVILRDQGCPLPAGTILLSPWVDLTHSFPSVAGDGAFDYIPAHGFLHRPSMAWPPPPTDGVKREKVRTFERPPADAVELPTPTGDHGADGDVPPAIKINPTSKHSPLPEMGENLRISLDGKSIEIKEQIQLYAPNDLLNHPLVSPVLQPSLGGLPPMLIQVGGGELLHDEQVYMAHKAANPKAYPPGDAILDEYDPRREILHKYPPTDVQLQVWEDLCHVPHTLSFTRPAKYMYRSVAQFGAWALAEAQHKEIVDPDYDALSIISSGGEEDGEPSASGDRSKTENPPSKTANGTSLHPVATSVGKAGDPLPPFTKHMIRQRVTRHGIIYPLAVPSEMACLHLDPASIGVIKPGPVRKWLAAKRVNEQRFANEKKRVQKKRAKEMAAGYDEVRGELPPATALVGRRKRGVAPEEKKKGKSWGLAMWSGWGSRHDESTLERQEQIDKAGSRQPSMARNGLPSAAQSTSNLGLPVTDQSDEKKNRRTSSASMLSSARSQREREAPRSPYRQAAANGQMPPSAVSESSPLGNGLRPPYSRRTSTTGSAVSSRPSSMAVAAAPTMGTLAPDSEKITGSQNTYLDSQSSQPHNGILAYPFRLRHPPSNPSIATLDSLDTSARSVQHEQAGGHNEPVELPTPVDRAVEAGAEFPARGPGASSPLSRQAYAPSSSATTSRTHRDERGSPIESQAEVSPVDAPRTTIPTIREPVFSHRTSVLGAIGADGMPIAPLLAQQSRTEPTERGAGDRQSYVGGTATTETESAPVSPIDGERSAPFKIRNPVYDARVDSDVNSSPTESTSRDWERSNQAKAQARLSTATPFKLRHVVYDPSAQDNAAQAPEVVTSDGSTAETTASPTATDGQGQTLDARRTADRAMTSVEPPVGDLPPNTNVTMPTVVSRRPMVMQNSSEPLSPRTPPRGDLVQTASPRTGRDLKTAGDMDPSATRLSMAKPPILDELKFDHSDLTSAKGEKDTRPTLETFVTAQEGTELHGRGF